MKHWMFVAGMTGTLIACSPPQTAENGDEAPATASQPEAKSIDALAGLKIVNFGPAMTKATTEPGARVDIWASADRTLEGYKATLWLNGQRLGNGAIAGATVTGTVPAALLATPGTFALEIRIGDNGNELTSQKVDFIVE